MTGPRANLATPQKVMREHGGELSFWLAWLSDDLDADLKAWFRRLTGPDPRLRRDLEAIDAPGGPEQLRHTLEATNYLAPRDPSAPLTLPPADSLTSFAVKDSAAGKQRPGTAAFLLNLAADRSGPRELYRRVSQSLFQLLEEVEIGLPPGGGDVLEAARLLYHLVGPEPVEHFRQLHRWLQDMRRRAANPNPDTLARLFQWLTPELFATDKGEPRYQLSYRLFLRGRLKDYCRQHGWKPQGPRFHDLDSAFNHLQRERIGEIVRQAVQQLNDEQPEWAGFSSHHALELLRSAG
jgi:hypothetical protein